MRAATTLAMNDMIVRRLTLASKIPSQSSVDYPLVKCLHSTYAALTIEQAGVDADTYFVRGVRCSCAWLHMIEMGLRESTRVCRYLAWQHVYRETVVSTALP
jgi:hypothetical protein